MPDAAEVPGTPGNDPSIIEVIRQRRDAAVDMQRRGFQILRLLRSFRESVGVLPEPDVTVAPPVDSFLAFDGRRQLPVSAPTGKVWGPGQLRVIGGPEEISDLVNRLGNRLFGTRYGATTRLSGGVAGATTGFTMTGSAFICVAGLIIGVAGGHSLAVRTEETGSQLALQVSRSVRRRFGLKPPREDRAIEQGIDATGEVPLRNVPVHDLEYEVTKRGLNVVENPLVVNTPYGDTVNQATTLLLAELQFLVEAVEDTNQAGIISGPLRIPGSSEETRFDTVFAALVFCEAAVHTGAEENAVDLTFPQLETALTWANQQINTYIAWANRRLTIHDLGQSGLTTTWTTEPGPQAPGPKAASDDKGTQSR